MRACIIDAWLQIGKGGGGGGGGSMLPRRQ